MLKVVLMAHLCLRVTDMILVLDIDDTVYITEFSYELSRVLLADAQPFET